MTTVEQFPHRIRPARGDPEGVLVMMHGRGTDEHDLFPLLDLIDPDARLVGITPRAPLQLAPGGYHWYIVRRVGFPDPDTFFPAYEALSQWVDALPQALGVLGGPVVLGGFSMGAVMSHALSLAAGRPSPAAVIPLSGFIPTVDGFELDLDSRAGLPVAIGHGAFDPIISVEFGRHARDTLTRAGADVLYRESPMAHSVDPAFLGEVAPWLRDHLAHV
jgi:phospholipase/carboxylesterase